MSNFGEVPPSELIVLERLVRNLGVRRVLEFGPGRSTECFASLCDEVDSFEHDPEWYDRMVSRFDAAENVRIARYENRVRVRGPFRPPYDLAFVDGPVGTASYSRLNVVKRALELSDHVLLHDGSRQGEKETAIVVKAFLGEAVRVEYLSSERGMYLFSKGDARRYPRDASLPYASAIAAEDGSVPVWVYWETLPWRVGRPAYLDVCLRLMQAYIQAPFELRFVTREDVLDAFPGEGPTGDDVVRLPNRVSYYRMLLLRRYGGIYVDFDTLIFRSFDALWAEALSHGFVCYGYGRDHPENGVIAAVPESDFVSACIDEQRRRMTDGYMMQDLPWFYMGRDVIRKVGAQRPFRMLPARSTYGTLLPEDVGQMIEASQPARARRLVESQWGLSLYNQHTVTERWTRLGELDLDWFEASDKTLALVYRLALERADVRNQALSG